MYGISKDIAFDIRFEIPSGVDYQISQASAEGGNRAAGSGFDATDVSATGCANPEWSGATGSRASVSLCASLCIG